MVEWKIVTRQPKGSRAWGESYKMCDCTVIITRKSYQILALKSILGSHLEPLLSSQASDHHFLIGVLESEALDLITKFGHVTQRELQVRVHVLLGNLCNNSKKGSAFSKGLIKLLSI